MADVLTAEFRRHRAELIDRIQRRHDVSDVFAQASVRLRRLIPFDSAMWVAADPATGLPVAPSRLESVEEADPDHCIAFWRREYEVDDLNPFTDLMGAETPVATLRQLNTDPNDSPRFREFLSPQGIDDELRLVLRASGHPWGMVSLWRRRGRDAFTQNDATLASSLSQPLGEALRSFARRGDQESDPSKTDGPGLLLFDGEGRLTSISDKACRWLDELPEERGIATDHGVGIPPWMMATVFKAADSETATARARVRTRRNIWLVCHGSVLRNTEGGIANTALVIEPAKAAEVAPIVIEAYELSQREQEIARLIARGASTGDIADRLYLSPHTVRDHIKAVFQKVGVSSRGELVASLFADHYWPQHESDVVRTNT